MWYVLALAVGGYVGFLLGHIDGREMAYRKELKKLRGYTRRAEVILTEAREL